MENHQLLRPLLRSSTANTVASPPTYHRESNKLLPSSPSILFRLSFVAFLGIVSVWAHHEASKGYTITILNGSSGHTLSEKRFHVFYESNDAATRVIIKASKIIESFIYPGNESTNIKPIRRIVLKLAGQNLIDDIIIDSGTGQNEFVLRISPSVMEGTKFDVATKLAVRRGVARVSLWDGQGNAPKYLMDGIVEYIMASKLGGQWDVPIPGRADPLDPATACWKKDDPRLVAGFLNHCERRRPGFVSRLNGAMKEGWDDGMMEGVLGLPIQNLCATYRESLRYNISSA